MFAFDRYYVMSPEDVIQYAREKLDLFDHDADLRCKEIGDGNINFVYRVWDAKTDRSVILKQAGETARISDQFKLSPNRIKIESDLLILEGRLAPGLVPLVYKYDDVMKCCVMEDLSDHEIMRTALLRYQTFPLFADHITTFMVNTLLPTTDVVMNHKEKKEWVKRYTNPDLCEISEDLVYTEPFNDYKGRNDVYLPNLGWIKEEIYNDQELRLEAAKLKFQFMNHAQALIHGDLHTGSIFVRLDSTKVIDPEFAFYGPIGYDVGNVVANLIFAWVNGDANITDPVERKNFLGWIEETIQSVVDLFSSKFLTAWKEKAREVLAKEKGFAEWYLETVMIDTAAVTGLELIRRIIGMAHVKDITSIFDERKRVRAERISLTAAKDFIKNRKGYRNGEDFYDTLKRAADQFPR